MKPAAATRQGHDPQLVGETIRLVIANAHPVMHLGLERLAEEHQDLEIIGQVTNSHDTLQQALALRPDVLILDTTMPGLHFLDLLDQLRSRKIKVLVLASESEQLYALRAFRNGAGGYLSTERSTDELVAAIRCISSGHRYVTPSEAELLALNIDNLANAAGHTSLSDREYEVFQLLIKGCRVSEIGSLLCLSPKTVSTYRARVLLKLHAETTADLVHYAYKHSLLPDKL